MAIDTTVEELVTLAEAVALFPMRTNVKALHRWRLKGTRGVKLECQPVGHRWYTSREAIQRFVTAQAAAPSGDTADLTRPATVSSARSNAARDELLKMGIGKPRS